MSVSNSSPDISIKEDEIFKVYVESAFKFNNGVIVKILLTLS